MSSPFNSNSLQYLTFMQQKRKNRISREKLYLSNGQVNLVFLKQVFADGQTLEIALLDEIITKFTNIVKQQPNLIKISDPVAVIGDIHGQLWDFIKLLSLIPSLQDNNIKYLFLGDYVDRGIYGCEVSILLYCMKINYPKQIFMLRGNHQSRIMTQMNNFLAEFCQKYHFPLFEKMMESFDALPFAAIINDKYFCVHGGISLEIMKYNPIDKLNQINRFQQIHHQGLMCDLYWADPIDDVQGKMQTIVEKNESRGCSVYFGAELTKKFLKKNNLLMIIRAHEILNLQGFKEYLWDQQSNQPLVLTIFSAPNYCGSYQNKAVILTIEQNKMRLRQFHQNTLKIQINPNYDAINVTLQKIMRVAASFMKYSSDAIVNKQFQDFKKVTKLPKQQKIKLLLAGKQKLEQEKAKQHPRSISRPFKSEIHSTSNNKKKQLLLESLSLIKLDSAICIQSLDGEQLKNMTQQKRKAFLRSEQFYKQKDMLPKKNKITQATNKQKI